MSANMSSKSVLVSVIFKPCAILLFTLMLLRLVLLLLLLLLSLLLLLLVLLFSFVSSTLAASAFLFSVCWGISVLFSGGLGVGVGAGFGFWGPSSDNTRASAGMAFVFLLFFNRSSSAKKRLFSFQFLQHAQVSLKNPAFTVTIGFGRVGQRSKRPHVRFFTEHFFRLAQY